MQRLIGGKFFIKYLILYIFLAVDTHKQVYGQEIVLIPEYKSGATCFGYCP
jgi:hypothetical protein